MSHMEGLQHLKIPLEDIKLATNNFSDENFIAKGGFGRVYRGKLVVSGQQTTVAVKKLDHSLGQGNREFLVEIQMLSCCRHKNLVSLVGFCDESEEKILVYEYVKHGSLDKHLSTDLSWLQRLRVSVGAARGFNYLHCDVGPQHRVLHRDIKSSNILLDENWEAKISDFGFSKYGPSNVEFTFLVTNACGTDGYYDPLYHKTGILTKESDVYSFGVVLFEILCGRVAYIDPHHDERRFLAPLAKSYFEKNRLDEIIPPVLRDQMNLGSLNTFSMIAYQCLKDERSERPSMGQILEKLTYAYELQVSFNISIVPGDPEDLRIPLEEIKKATKNFHVDNYIAKGGFGRVYKGELFWLGSHTTVAVKQFEPQLGQGSREFLMEITILSSYRHKNLVSLVGFCDESGEKILVYVHESRGSLNRYISDTSLTWLQRLRISIGAARGLTYLHHEVAPQHRVLHQDIKSSNILLNEAWEAKVSDFGLSKVGPLNMEMSGPCGTFGYIDPLYLETGVLMKESDVYSFGVVLFEILCGRMACLESYQDGRFLGPLAKHSYEQKKLDEIINPNLRKQMKLNALQEFSSIAYQCLNPQRTERPPMYEVLDQLEYALELQVSLKTTEVARVGIWGTKSREDPQNHWSFQLEKDHRLKMITIDHGDLIYSLMFTSESKGVLHTSPKVGGWNTGDTVSEVIFEDDEEIIHINGTVGISSDCYPIISSLSFITNKTTHGPFGRARGTPFDVPWNQGSFGGLYGVAGSYIDGIGVYMKASSNQITRVGIWGRKPGGGPQNQWSFRLKRNHHLKNITIDHGSLIYSLMFTTQYRGLLHTSDKAGGWNGGDVVTKVAFDPDEEVSAISGTVGISEGTDAGYTIISSLSFITNRRSYGPFGLAKGTPFMVPWDKGSFAGFYGLAGDYIDGIGVYLKATM